MESILLWAFEYTLLVVYSFYLGERPLIFGIRSDDPEREMFQNSITFFPRIHEALPLYICCCVS